jgi:hypothetical protein
VSTQLQLNNNINNNFMKNKRIVFDRLLMQSRSLVGVLYTQRSGRKADQDVISGGGRRHSLNHYIQTAGPSGHAV